jgi:hypothetical protein
MLTNWAAGLAPTAQLAFWDQVLDQTTDTAPIFGKLAAGIVNALLGRGGDCGANAVNDCRRLGQIGAGRR